MDMGLCCQRSVRGPFVRPAGLGARGALTLAGRTLAVGVLVDCDRDLRCRFLW